MKYILIATDATTRQTVYLHEAGWWTNLRSLAARMRYVEARKLLNGTNNSVGVQDTAIVPE